MTIENLFETAAREEQVRMQPARKRYELTSRNAGYLVVGLHTRDFLDIAAYHMREITELQVTGNDPRYHNNGIVHEILRGNFDKDKTTHRELCFAGNVSSDVIVQRVRGIRDCGYYFPFDIGELKIASDEQYTSVRVPEDQFVRESRYFPIMRDYIRRTREGLLILPCPAVYYASSVAETEEAMKLLKEQFIQK